MKLGQKGLTLVEVTVALAILGIVSILLTVVVSNYGQIFEKQKAQVEVGLSARFVLDEIVSKVRESTQIIPAININGQDFTTNSTTLILEVSSLDTNGQIIPGVVDHIIFYQDEEEIVEKTEPSPQSSRQKYNQVLISQAKEITFSYDNPDVSEASEVTIDLTTTKTQFGKPTETQDIAKAVLRNF